MYFFHKQGDSQKAVSWNFAIYQHGYSVSLKILKKLDEWRVKYEVTGLKTVYSMWAVSGSDVLKK